MMSQLSMLQNYLLHWPLVMFCIHFTIIYTRFTNVGNGAFYFRSKYFDMKKVIFIFTTAILSLGVAAVAWVGWNEAQCAATRVANEPALTCNAVQTSYAEIGFDQLVFGRKETRFWIDVGTRFNTTISKTDLLKAVSAMDVVPTDSEWSMYPIEVVRVSLLRDGSEVREASQGAALDEKQQQMLRSLHYSESFYITAGTKNSLKIYGETAYYDLVYYVTVTPEKQARYSLGLDELITYLRSNSRAERSGVQDSELTPGKLHFTITKEGKTTDIGLESSSGYPEVDARMIELIGSAPGTWEPAADADGNPVEQEFVISFGALGC